MGRRPTISRVPVNVNSLAGVLAIEARLLDRTPGPHPFLRDKVESGKLGMKTGEGFRVWTAEKAEKVRNRLRRFLAEQARAGKTGE